jgi:hypothetical protein
MYFTELTGVGNFGSHFHTKFFEAILIKDNAMKACGGDITPTSSASAIDGRECSSSRPCRLTPQRQNPRYTLHTGPRASLNAKEEIKISFHGRESNPDSSVVQPAA